MCLVSLSTQQKKKDFSLACHWVHSCVSAACASVSADNEEHHWNLWTAHHWNLCTRFDAMSRHDWHCRESLARRIGAREKRDERWVLVHDPQSALRTSNRKFKKPGPSLLLLACCTNSVTKDYPEAFPPSIAADICLGGRNFLSVTFLSENERYMSGHPHWVLLDSS